MKTKLTIFCLLLSITVSLFGQGTINTNKAYMSNPELALKDALNYTQRGDISNAILCYKKYAALTGKDMTSEISELERKQYPSWYDASSMLALPMNDGSLLIVHKGLRNYSAWDLPDNITIPGITGTWDKEVNQEKFKTIQQMGMYIPSEGLYHMEISSGVSMPKTIAIKRGGRVIRTVEIPDESKSLTIYMITANGEIVLDCGSYEKKGFWNGKTVTLTESDNRRNYRVYFYPNRKMRYINGYWQIENNSTTINSKASTTTSY